MPRLPPPRSPTSSRQLSSAMAAATAKEAPPPPMIGKVGKFTVFITPPRSDSPPASPGLGVRDTTSSPSKASPSTPAPPVQVPSLQCGRQVPKSSGSVFGFFWDAFAKVQHVHSNLDEYLAHWFGLNRSKYQWALNDYIENNGKEKEAVKAANQTSLPENN